MLTPKQTMILSAFLMYPHQDLTYNQIKAHSKERSNAFAQKAVRKYIEDGIVTKKNIGNVLLYRMNLKNPKALAYMRVAAEEQLPKTARSCLRIISEELEGIPFKSLVVFGSYAKGEQKDRSDLDVAVLVKDAEDKKKALLSLKSAEIKCLLKVDYHVFTRVEMLEMLKDRRENLGKQIARRHLAVSGAETFYSIVDEGVRNGFDITH